MANVAKTLMALGVLLFMGAVGWWYAFYEQFFGGDVKQASECFYFTTEVCSYGEVAAVVSRVPVYSPVLLWAAAAAFGAGVLIIALNPLRR